MHQWGWVVGPPGADKLGSGDYAGVTVQVSSWQLQKPRVSRSNVPQDVINSSLDAYNVAGYNYDNVTAINRVKSAIEGQWANPATQGPSWEGTFTIPVCDVGGAVNSHYQGKQYILQPYGHDSRPMWCGPVCSGNLTQTKAFIHAAKMDNFQSPKHLCDYPPGY